VSAGLGGQVSGLLFDSWFNESCTDFTFDAITEIASGQKNKKPVRGKPNGKKVLSSTLQKTGSAKGTKKALMTEVKLGPSSTAKGKRPEKLKELIGCRGVTPWNGFELVHVFSYGFRKVMCLNPGSSHLTLPEPIMEPNHHLHQSWDLHTYNYAFNHYI
jgi:hypothetical protein